MASPQPLYDPAQVRPAYQLRYSWTGWITRGTLPEELEPLLATERDAWETDGLRVLESRWHGDFVQILFSTTPAVSPVFLAARAKGRLDHALRGAGAPVVWSRKVAVRTVGDTTRQAVEDYISEQVAKEHFVDSRFAQRLQGFTVETDVDLSHPSESNSGRYWNNLHVVLVTDGRVRLFGTAHLVTIRDVCLRVAEKHRHQLSRAAVMPDHLHLALRAPMDRSPNEMVFSYQNNLAFFLGLGGIWRESFYVGTFGEYTTAAVNRAALAARAGHSE